MQIYLRKRGGVPLKLDEFLQKLEEFKSRNPKMNFHGRDVWLPKPGGRGREPHRFDEVANEIVTRKEFRLREEKRRPVRDLSERAGIYFCRSA